MLLTFFSVKAVKLSDSSKCQKYSIYDVRKKKKQQVLTTGSCAGHTFCIGIQKLFV